MQESGIELNPSCCDEINVCFLYLPSALSFPLKVVFFSPKLPSSDQNMYGLAATPKIDARFYFDLAKMSLTAVRNMKSEEIWPEITYAKCSEFTTGDAPIDRAIDLATSMKVI